MAVRNWFWLGFALSGLVLLGSSGPVEGDDGVDRPGRPGVSRVLAPGIGAMLGRGRQPVPASEDLSDRVLRLETIVRGAEGTRSRILGSGFVVGRRLITVHHNLASAFGGRGQTFLQGEPVVASVVQPTFDLAFIDVPRALCSRWCNRHRLARVSVQPDEAVRWLRNTVHTREVNVGRVVDLVVLGRGHDTGTGMHCGRHLVARIDKPFLPGSSGGPVLSVATGAIVGVVQGSIGRGATQQGFFKPIECVIDLYATSDVTSESVATLEPTEARRQ
ncbi:MAG: trypsin-like peptidase domain-containing protein [Pseudomonadota bacterium]